ncbi:hypothetical protein Tco_0981379 [Tanacetum coccineum]
MAMSIDARLSMEHTDVQGHVVFTSHAWRRLFEIRGPLVREMMMEFFSTYRFADTVLDLGNAVVRELTEINLDELSRLHIYKRMADTWAWVSPRLRRQHVDAAGALKDVKGAPAIDEGV